MKKMMMLFFVACILLTTKQAVSQDTAWVRDNTWFFDNYKMADLPWEWFRESFVGVGPHPAPDTDLLFYELLFRNELTKDGHCFGMCAMAMLLLKNGGHLGYCHPPYIYNGNQEGPSDSTLRAAIAFTHGNQINHGFLSFLLDLMAINKSRDGRYAYQQTAFYLARNDYPVISITEGIVPTGNTGGHVVLPYFLKDLGSTKRIYVYDPGRSWYLPGAIGKDWYTSGNNYISINNSGEWTYTRSSGEVWSGSPSSGGHCMAIPLSVAGRKDRLPQSLLVEGAYTINTIFIFGSDVKVAQISDPHTKRHLFNKEGTDWETRASKRLKNVLPFIPLGGTGSGTATTPAVYFVRGDSAVDCQIRAKGDYRIGFLFGGKYTEYKGTGNGELQQFRTPGKAPKPLFLNQHRR